MERKRNWNVFLRTLVLVGAGLWAGLFLASFPAQGDGTCVAVRDAEGNLHPCDWSPPQQNYNNDNNNQEIQREQERERERQARERQEERERGLQVQQRERQVQERERAALLKQQALIRQRKKSEALKQLQVAHHHGEIARHSGKARSAAQSQIGFDKPGSSGKGSGIIEIDHMGWRMKVPRKIARNPGFRKLDRQMTALITKHRALQTKLRKVEHRLRQATDTKHKETLQMEVVRLKQANAKIASQAAMVHMKEKDFVSYHMNLTVEGSP